jgi:hypothetical protein
MRIQKIPPPSQFTQIIRGAVVSSNLFGAFYEEINYAGEGGLYAEMVRNRSFYDSKKVDFWTLVAQGDAKETISVDTANPLNDASRLPKDAFFFGFGNINGDGGHNYLFCAPQSGRIAITDSNYAREQNAYANFDLSFHSKVHLTAVFNPPLGCVAFYTNGGLAAVNRSVTTPLSSVQDVCNYIGRSLYSPDPYADLTLDEFRIYNDALNAGEIAKTQALGPDRLPVNKRPLSQRRKIWRPAYMSCLGRYSLFDQYNSPCYRKLVTGAAGAAGSLSIFR